jgi:hypothetical protein
MRSTRRPAAAASASSTVVNGARSRRLYRVGGSIGIPWSAAATAGGSQRSRSASARWAVTAAPAGTPATKNRVS